MAILILIIIFFILIVCEKTDSQRSKEADKLPSFTKQDAETYYTQTFKP